jgi:hypothetical protein
VDKSQGSKSKPSGASKIQNLCAQYEESLDMTFPAHVKKLSAANNWASFVSGKPKGYVVWKKLTEQSYGYGETDITFDSTFSSLDDANQRAKYVFYVLNPSGLDYGDYSPSGKSLDEFLQGKTPDEHQGAKGALASIGVKIRNSDGLKMWKVGVMTSKDFEKQYYDEERRSNSVCSSDDDEDEQPSKKQQQKKQKKV